MGDRLRAGIPSRYATSQLGQLSLASLQGRLIEYPSVGWGKGGNVTSSGWQVTLCDPMWHVSSRSGVATLRSAIHLLLTYLLCPRNDRKINTLYQQVCVESLETLRLIYARLLLSASACSKLPAAVDWYPLSESE